MNSLLRRTYLFVLVLAAIPLAFLTGVRATAIAALPSPSKSWPQWGGVTRDFKIHSASLADKWPSDGPKRLWTHPLGDGHSGVVVGDGRLYTMYREDGDEIIVALRSTDGQKVWRHRCSVSVYEAQSDAYGYGPNATPLLLNGRLFTVGFTGVMHAFDAASGRPLWSLDLVKDLHGNVQYYGYSNSPLAYKNTLITLVGGDESGIVALTPDDGSMAWRSAGNDISYAAPLLINVDGQDQVVFFSPTEVIGLDPTNGSYLWRHPVVNFCRTNCTSAIWGRDNLLWAATKGVGGTRVLKLSRKGNETSVEEVWMNRKIRVYHWNGVRIGDLVYTSIGDSAKRLAAININTGEVVERIRGFGSTNGIHADGKLILLDESGMLALAKPTPAGLTIVSRAQISDSVSWTPPTLVGTTLYIRDNERVSAFDLK